MISRKEKLAVGVLLTSVLMMCSVLFYQNLLLLCFFPLLYPKGKAMYAVHRDKKRDDRILLEFRDFLFSLSTSFSTGRHMEDAMAEARAYLAEIHGEKSALAGELDFMLKSMRETGETDLEVLQKFAQKTNLEDISTFVDVFRACRETGGDLVSAVNKAAVLISEKIGMEREIQTMISQKKFEGRIIGVMPLVMIFFLQWMSPSYLDVMYTTAAGRLMMSVALVIQVLTFLWMERMTNIEL